MEVAKGIPFPRTSLVRAWVSKAANGMHRYLAQGVAGFLFRSCSFLVASTKTIATFGGSKNRKWKNPAPSKSKRSQMFEVPKREIEETLTKQEVSRPRGLDCQASGQSPAQSRQTPRPLRSPHAALAPPRRSLPRGSTPTRTV